MELKAIRGIGPGRLEALRAAGIASLRDFLCALPVRYEDRTRVTPVREAQPGSVLVEGVVERPPRSSYTAG